MFLSLEQEIRNTMMRIDLDTRAGGPSSDDLERLSTLFTRWTNLCWGGRSSPVGGLREGAASFLNWPN